MVKLISFILFILILCGDYFAQPKLFGYKISGNGDIMSDVFLIQEGFVLDSAIANNSTFRFEYDKNGKLKRDSNFLKFVIYDSITGMFKPVPGYRNYFYNERGDVDSVGTGIWNGTMPAVDSAGYKINHIYDNEGNILSKIYSTNGVAYRIEENSYDASGNLILNRIILTAQEDTTVSIREYDSQNRLIKTSSSQYPYYRINQVLYQYDNSGNVNCTFQSIDYDTLYYNGWNYYIEFDEFGKAIYQVQSRSFNPADSTWDESFEVLINYDEFGRILEMGKTYFHYNSDGNLDSLFIIHPIESGYLGGRCNFIDSFGNKISIPEYNGIIKSYYSSIIANIEKNNLEGLNFSLSQNYPNPFNPATTITYSLTKSSLVILKIYDILGKEIVTLVNEDKQSGTYNVTWNAQDVTSGVYFYKIIIGEHSKTNKMLLLK